jgi:hypothetical protein
MAKPDNSATERKPAQGRSDPARHLEGIRGMGSSKQKSTTVAEPWAPVQPALKGMLPDIQANYAAQRNQPFFPGQTYASFDPAQSGALSGIEGLAQSQINGSGLMPAATDYTRDVLAGKYLDFSGPQFKGVIDPVMASTAAMWSKAGRGTGNYGGSGVAADTAKGITSALAPYYAMERGNMEAAAGRAQSLDQAAYDPYAAMYGVGEARQAMDDKGIQEEMARYYYDPEGAALATEIDQLTRLGSMGGTQTTTQTASPSIGQTVAGAGLTAAGLYYSPFKYALPWMHGSMGAAG